MQSIFVAAAAAATASALTVEESHVARFNNWKTEHGKAYTSIEQEELRFEIFMQNHEAITSHNDDSTQTYTMSHNSFSDYTPEEFKAMYTGYVPVEGHKSGADNVHRMTDGAPASRDWRTEGKVTAVKNQGQCGSCWAFSTTGSIEAANLIKNGGSASDQSNILSEQELVDCSRANSGCQGGLMDLGFQFVKNQGVSGDDTESSYAYKGRNGRCKKENGVTSKIQVVSYTDVTSGSEDALANAIGTHGPVSVAIEADQRAFQFYNGGVLTSGCGQNLDHGVLAVGYTDEYFIVKNSWGPSWGEQGYIKIGRGKNLCGIANQASYPIVA